MGSLDRAPSGAQGRDVVIHVTREFLETGVPPTILRFEVRVYVGLRVVESSPRAGWIEVLRGSTSTTAGVGDDEDHLSRIGPTAQGLVARVPMGPSMCVRLMVRREQALPGPAIYPIRARWAVGWTVVPGARVVCHA